MPTKTLLTRPSAALQGSSAGKKYVPGLLLCAAAVAIAMTVNAALPAASPLIIAIVL